MGVDKRHFHAHLREARQGECTDGHHHVADSDIEVAGQGEIQRDENQPGARDVGAETRAAKPAMAQKVVNPYKTPPA